MIQERAGPGLVSAALGFLLLVCSVPEPASAQFLGHNFRGDYGLQSGSQPPPGVYLSGLYLRYDAGTLRDRNGNSVGLDPERRGELDVNAYSLGLWWVSNIEILGANYSVVAFPGWTDNALEAPIVDLQQSTSVGFADLYLQPINLGWHTERADYIAGLGVFAPTGRYSPEADDNLGLGMWSFELFGGTTVFFDQAKSWHFATTAFYEMHTKKQDTDIRVGDILTLEGGLGKSFLQGAASVGVAYYAQWKVTADDLGAGFGVLPESPELPKNRVFGIGPEVTYPIATKKKLYAFLTARYLWESGARSTLEGQTFVFSATFPIPSVPLQ